VARSADALFETLRRELSARPHETLAWPGFRRAAVLVPVLRATDGLQLLFTVRSSRLANHAGQIAFPGGRLEPGESPAQAALRETFEETGLTLPEGAILGRLHDHPSPARYLVTPLVGVLPWPQTLQPNPLEVAEVFCVPLAELLALTPRQEVRELEGYRRVLHFYTHRSAVPAAKERLIWGLTGNILADFLGVVRPHL
jgi:8-oxo-dGTP pyrophosphatase MutT (NUDIX family)